METMGHYEPVKKEPVDLCVVAWKVPKALLLSETTIPLGGEWIYIPRGGLGSGV